MLSIITGLYDNPNGKHSSIKEATQAMLIECTNVTRVMAPVRELCAVSIANIPVSTF